MKKKISLLSILRNRESGQCGRMKNRTIVILTIIILVLTSAFVFAGEIIQNSADIDREVRISLNTEIKRMTDVDATYLLNNEMTHASGQYLLEYATYYLKTFGTNVDNMNSLSPKTPVSIYYTMLDDEGNAFRTFASSDSSPMTIGADEMQTLFRESQYEKPDEDGDMCYYRSRKLGNGYVIVSYWIEDFQKSALDEGEPYLARADGILLWLDNTGAVVSSNEEKYEGRTVSDVFSTQINRTYGYVKSYETGWGYYECESVGDRKLIVFLPMKEIAAEIFRGTVVPIVLLWIVVLAILRYILGLSQERENLDAEQGKYVKASKQLYLEKDIASHIVSLAILGSLIIGATIIYVSSLISYSDQNILASDNLRGISTVYDTNQLNRVKAENDVKSEFIEYAEIVAWGMMRNNQTVDDHTLKSMVNMISMMKSAKVTDGTATIVASTTNEDGYTLGRNGNSINSLCWQIMDGEIDNALYAKGESSNGKYDITLLVRRQDAKGVVIIEMAVDYLPEYVDSWTLEETMLTADMGGALTIALRTSDPETIYVAAPNAEHVENLNLALNDKIMENGYAGVQRLKGVKCYVNTLLDSSQGVLFISAMPIKDFPATGAFKGLLQIILAMLLFSLLLLYGVAGKKMTSEDLEKVVVDKSPMEVDESTIEDMRKRFFNSENVINESFKSVITKMIVANGILLFLLLIVDYLFEEKPLLVYLLGSQWSKGLNLFSATMILLVLVSCSLFGFAFSKIIMMIFRNMGPRGMTVGHLLVSLSRFILFVVAIIWSLIEVGCNLSALLTGAGIAGAAISLCASSTINDLLAGFFIVFEGAFKIGDWVKVGDWRGQVLEIGMRTTRIACGDCIKIINNATMTNVTVMDYCNSGALVAIEIAYKEDAEKVIQLLNANRANYRATIPEIADGPFVKGITELGSSGVTIEMYALGKQEKIGKIERDIRLQTKKLFDENGIEIPFNQVTIHQAEDEH